LFDQLLTRLFDAILKTTEYEARSRVRSRIDGPLKDYVEDLREHDPELLDELRAVVCEEE